MPSTVCGWCTAYANMRQVDDGVVRDEGGGYASVMGTFRCDHCGRLLLAYAQTPRDSVSYLGANKVYFDSLAQILSWLPQRATGKDFSDVPLQIADAAGEAHRCFSIDADRAAVLLARAVIEAAAKDKGIEKGNLADKINKMFDQKLIREHVRDEAHEVRHLGNDMAHGDFVEPVDHDDADAVLTLMGEILEEVYQSPAITARLRQRREAKNAKSSSLA